MRKLTVKNFSVIKDAESTPLEFGKITVLIGPQSSGKSLLCKLAYFLGRETIDLAVSAILVGKQWDEYLRDVQKSFGEKFPVRDRLDALNTNIEYSAHRFEISVDWGTDFNLVNFEFGDEFKRRYEYFRKEPRQGGVPAASGALVPGGISEIAHRESVWIALNHLLAEPTVVGAIYIPAGRAFFTNTSKGFAALQNTGLDSITREFAAQIQWDNRWKVGMLTLGRPVNDEIMRRITDTLGGFVLMDSGVPRFLTKKGHKLPFEILSTGVQEMLPLFNILEQLMFSREHLVASERARDVPPSTQKPVSSKSLIYLEEPEANVFPKTQYDLVQLFAWLAADPILDFSWVITTHSPYILSAFNNIIEASQVVAAKPELKEEVAKLIPEQYWIKSSDFKAYCIQDGNLDSIMDSETGLVSANYLDGVSETIGVEFDELLRLGYVES